MAEVPRPEECLSAWSERRPNMSEAERAELAERLSAHLPPLPFGQYWPDADFDAIKAAYIKRFNEDLPRTETLMAIAAIGYRIALRDMALKALRK